MSGALAGVGCFLALVHHATPVQVREVVARTGAATVQVPDLSEARATVLMERDGHGGAAAGRR